MMVCVVPNRSAPPAEQEYYIIQNDLFINVEIIIGKPKLKKKLKNKLCDVNMNTFEYCCRTSSNYENFVKTGYLLKL